MSHMQCKADLIHCRKESLPMISLSFPMIPLPYAHAACWKRNWDEAGHLAQAQGNPITPSMKGTDFWNLCDSARNSKRSTSSMQIQCANNNGIWKLANTFLNILNNPVKDSFQVSFMDGTYLSRNLFLASRQATSYMTFRDVSPFVQGSSHSWLGHCQTKTDGWVPGSSELQESLLIWHLEQVYDTKFCSNFIRVSTRTLLGNLEGSCW